MARKYHLTQKDRDFIGRKLKKIDGVGKGEMPLPRRRRGVDSGGTGDNLPFQLAVVTVATQEPTYTGSGLTFQIDNTPPDGKAILLNTALADSDPFVVDTTAGTTLAALEFNFYNAHRDVPIGVGDVIRVWKRTGELVESGETGGLPIIFGEHYSATEALRRLDGYAAAPAEPIVLAAFDNVLYWDTIPEWVFDTPDPPAGTTYTAGYGMDLDGTVFHNNPTEWTNFAAQFQFFAHLSTDTTRTQPAWKTVADYDAAKNQMWWHQSGAWKAETTTDYGGSATEPQFLLNWGAGNGGEWQWKSATGYDNTAATQLMIHTDGSWQWKTITGYSAAATQLIGHISGTWHAKTIAEWLNLLAGYVAGNDQTIGHDASGATEWQDDGDCTA